LSAVGRAADTEGVERTVAAELEALRRTNDQREKRAAVRRKRIIVGLLLAVLALLGLWISGRMDPMLAQAGLNYHDCFKNAFGATFCGDAAMKYQAGVQGDFDTSAKGAAKAWVRSAVPSVEAFYFDHNNYSGMTVPKLRRYDNGLRHVTVVSATEQAYCLESTVEGETVSISGPGGSVVSGPC
jgi:hypothetical protein